MATWLKQSTAVEIKLGPFVDSGDGNTVEDGLTIEDEHVDLAKNGGDWGDKSETTTLVHESQGWYRCLLNDTDTNTLGILIVKSHPTGALAVWREFMVVAANVYDSLIGGGDTLDVQVTGIGANVITATAINADAITDAKVASDVTIASVTGAVGSVAGNVTGSVGSIATGGIVAASFAADSITAAKLHSDVTTELQSGLATAASITTLSAFVDTEVASILAAVDTEVAAILADTNELQTDWVDGGRLDLILDARASQTSVDDLPTNAELATSQAAADDATLAQIALVKAQTDLIPSDPADASVVAGLIGGLDTKLDTIDDFLDLEVAAILADTNELQTDWVDGGRLDLLIDAIKGKTDGLPSDPADASVIAGRFDTLDTSVADLPTNAELATALGTADNAILAILGTPVDTDIATDISNISAGSGLDAAGVRAAVGLASANLDTQLGDLPTNAELATALGTADDAILTQVALVKTKTDLIPGTVDGKTFEQHVMLQSSVLLGKVSGAGTGTEVFRSVDDGEDRVTASVDGDGNRTSISLNTA